MSRTRKVSFVTTEADVGQRLDQVLATHIPELSRRQARVLLDIGGVFVERARSKKAGKKLRAGQLIEAHLGGALARAGRETGRDARKKDAQALPAYRVVHEDRDIVVVDKPAGLLTAPTPESDRGNLADALMRDGRPRVYVVHRIDLGTSGLLVLAKTRAANKTLSECFRDHTITREYLAVLAGRLADERVTVKLEIKGKRAATHLWCGERLGDTATVVRARLETGRTHQIRIHCRHIGHPVLGDRRYGRRTPGDPPRMALHAAHLGLAHPLTGERLDFVSPWPVALDDWLNHVRAREGLPSPPPPDTPDTSADRSGNRDD